MAQLGSPLSPTVRTDARQGPEPRGFEAFLSALLARESGLHPSLFDWYVANLANEVITFPAVSRPGHAVRDPATGGFVLRRMTVRDYFAALGVLDLFDEGDPACIQPMQHAATNPLGFVGYQIGEAILVRHGYYCPKRVRISGRRGRAAGADAYYLGPNDLAGSSRGATPRPVSPTEVNRWDGVFLGKNGLGSLKDLKTPAVQERVIRDILSATVHELKHALTSCGLRFPDDFPRRHNARPHDALPVVEITLSASGLLAAAHLCGVEAIRRFFQYGRIPRDEYGTSMLDYLVEFDDYESNLWSSAIDGNASCCGDASNGL